MSIIDDIWNQIQDIAETVGDVVGSLTDDVTNNIIDVQKSLDNVTSAIKSKVDSALSALGDELATIIQAIKDEIALVIQTMQDTLSPLIDGLRANIQDAISGIRAAFDTVSSNVLGFVTKGVSDIATLAARIGGDLQVALVNGLAWVQQAINDASGYLQAEIQTTIDAMSSTLATTVTALQGVVGEITRGFDNLQKSMEENPLFKSIFNDGVELIKGEMGISRKESSSLLHDKLKLFNRLARGESVSLEQVIEDLTDPAPVIGAVAAIVFSMVIGPAVGQIVASAVNPLTIPVQQGIMERLLPVALSPEAMASAVVQSYKTQDQGVAESAKSGISPERFQTLVDLTGSPPANETVLTLLNRGQITQEQARQAILESRLKPKYTEAFLTLAEIIPPVSDLIQFAVKDAFDPDVISRFGLDQQYPSEINPWLRKHGLSEDWGTKYWTSHWRLLGIEQVMEMLWRSPETGVTLGDVRAFLKQADIAPYWRDKVIAIAYKKFTRVDLRRMYKTGQLDRVGVKRGYLDDGYNEQDAEKLTEYTVVSEDETGYLNPDNQERRLWNQSVDLYVRDLRSLDDLRQMGKNNGWKGKALENELVLAEWRKEEYIGGAKKEKALVNPETLQRRIIDELVTLYVKGYRGLDSISSTMQEFGVDQETIDYELLIATYRKEAMQKVSRTDTLKELSISAILDAMTIHAIAETEAQSRLVALGLSETDAKLEIQIAHFQEASKVRNQIVAAIKSSYLAALMNENEALAQLAKFGFAPDEVNSYLTAWSLEKTLKHKTFSESQLASFLKKSVIDLDTYAEQLASIGYSTQQIDWLKQSRGA